MKKLLYLTGIIVLVRYCNGEATPVHDDPTTPIEDEPTYPTLDEPSNPTVDEPTTYTDDEPTTHTEDESTTPTEDESTTPTENGDVTPTGDLNDVLDENNVPIDLSEDENWDLIDLPLCPSHHDWSFEFSCHNPKEEIQCKVYDDKPECKCERKHVCSSRGTHNTGSKGDVPCVYMCKSPERMKMERDDAHKYEMGLLLLGKKK